MIGFFGKIYLFFAGWANQQYLLVTVGLVTSVIQDGYKINDRILRPARVVVSKAPVEETQTDKQEEE